MCHLFISSGLLQGAFLFLLHYYRHPIKPSTFIWLSLENLTFFQCQFALFLEGKANVKGKFPKIRHKNAAFPSPKINVVGQFLIDEIKITLVGLGLTLLPLESQPCEKQGFIVLVCVSS